MAQENIADRNLRKIRVKIVLVGDGGVGKTSIARRYLGEAFRGEYKKTIGAEFYVKKNIYHDDELGDIQIEWLIWDLAGQPTFDQVRPLYYRGAKASLVVFDITRPETYYNVPKWINEFWKHSGGVFPFVLVGNKVDLRDAFADSAVPSRVGFEYARVTSKYVGVQIPYIETSAKTGENIEQAFDFLARVIIEYSKVRLRKVTQK